MGCCCLHILLQKCHGGTKKRSHKNILHNCTLYQLHDKDLVFGKNCKCAFDVLSSELKSNLLYGARSFYEASLRHLIKKFPFENIILQCCKVLHPDSCTSDSSLARHLNTW